MKQTVTHFAWNGRDDDGDGLIDFTDCCRFGKLQVENDPFEIPPLVKIVSQRRRWSD